MTVIISRRASLEIVVMVGQSLRSAGFDRPLVSRGFLIYEKKAARPFRAY
jgi:hypothetical protein